MRPNDKLENVEYRRSLRRRTDVIILSIFLISFTPFSSLAEEEDDFDWDSYPVDEDETYETVVVGEGPATWDNGYLCSICGAGGAAIRSRKAQ